MRVGCNVTHTVIITKQQPLAANGNPTAKQSSNKTTTKRQNTNATGPSWSRITNCSLAARYGKSRSASRKKVGKSWRPFAGVFGLRNLCIMQCRRFFRLTSSFLLLFFSSGWQTKSESPIKQLTDEAVMESDLEQLHFANG